MTELPGMRKPRRAFGVMLIGIVTLFPASIPAFGAEEASLPAGSLKLVPEKVAFYTTMLRCREQIEAIAKSRAWAKLMAMPVVKTGLEMFHKEFSEEGNLAILYNLYQQEENKQLVALLGEMFSDEVFVCGGQDWEGVTEVLQGTAGAVYNGMVKAMAQGQAGNSEVLGRTLLEFLAENTQKLKIPDLVIGFKIKNADIREGSARSAPHSVVSRSRTL